MYSPAKELGGFKKFLYKSLPYLVFIVSALFSATGAHDYYSESNPVIANILAGVFVGIGFTFSIAISQFEYALKLVDCRVTSFLLGLFLFAWLGVSSLYNFSYLSMSRSVDAEIIERAVSADIALTPVLENSKVINDKLLPLLDDLISNLDHKIEQQETKLGGCHQICDVLINMKAEMESIQSTLSTDYDEQKVKKINKLLEKLSNLSLQTDISWQEKLQTFTSAFLALKHDSNQFLTMSSPSELLDKVAFEVQSQKNQINTLDISSNIAKTALLDANAMLVNFEKTLTETKNRLKPLKNEPLIFSPITTSFVLLFKQIKHSLDLVVIAAFLDSLAIALVLSNLLIYRKLNP